MGFIGPTEGSTKNKKKTALAGKRWVWFLIFSAVITVLNVQVQSE